MAFLTPQQRNTLETAVKLARRLSEIGAVNALRTLAVDNPEPFAHMNPEQRSLRNSLRSKARLLGDDLPSNGYQQINHLEYELAYEYWHKMLFAKFLEANGLLMHPNGVSVTMEECEELAKDEGFIDKWDTAANYASSMLPAIFRPEDPLMKVQFAPNDRINLEEIIDSLDKFIFGADDALGWVYQFWQSDAKEIINKSGDKINGAKLPAVTQLFTEPYMVHFLIDNTLGAWWVGRNPERKPPLKFEYLRLLEDGTPAAGKFEGWPNRTSEITALDPCMGSGHFVVSLFLIFANLRMHEEGLSKEEATDRVISENLHGLEIDARCTQIAAFNLALTAWKFCGHYRELPEMNLACSGIAPKGKKEDWVKLVGKVERVDDKARMENGMAALYDHFQLAPELGSLLDPSTIKADLHTASFDQLYPVLKKALEHEADKDIIERGVIAAGIAKAGYLLTKKIWLQITNVPYLARGKQDVVLANYALKNYPDAKADLANIFLDKILKSIKSYGIVSIVMPQNWLFLTTYKKFREKLLKNESWKFVARLGSGAFSQISGEVVKVILISISNARPTDKNQFTGLDVSDKLNAAAKDEAIKTTEINTVSQKKQFGNPDSAIVFKSQSNYELLNKYATSFTGVQTGDDNYFTRFFYELNNCLFPKWIVYQGTTSKKDIFGGKDRILLWENGKGELANNPGSYIRSKETLTKKAISIQLIGLGSTLFERTPFDMNVAGIVPHKEELLSAIWCFINSEEYKISVKSINQKLNVTNAIVVKVPFDLIHWRKVALEKFPNGLPKPFSDDPTQWLFHGHPVKSDFSLQVALARLLGYRWPAETDTEMELSIETKQLIKDIKKFDNLSNLDGIICIPSVNSEETGADRLRNYLKAIWGNNWDNNILSQLLATENAKSTNIESWLRSEFFVQHCKEFNNRPFIWHIWDGRNDGFSALVNYHKLNKENLSKLIYTYLGDWIHMCESKKKTGESGADGLLSAALKLKEKLELILEGEAPYDIFVRWKPLEEQPIGWDPDLNDGVRLNIRPFMEADVLRKKPNIKWGIDRGKNPPGTSWGEVRDNDQHKTLAEKKVAKERK